MVNLCSGTVQALDMGITPLDRAKIKLFKGVFALGGILNVLRTIDAYI